jgi:hypothetical protein
MDRMRISLPGHDELLCLMSLLTGTYSDSNDELLQGVPAVKKGKKLEGQFFPLLFDPNKA